MATLDLHGLTKSFGGTSILAGIDLALTDGEMLVIVGASGCGKSTLLRLVAGLEEPTAGRIVLGGQDVTRTDPAAPGLMIPGSMAQALVRMSPPTPASDVTEASRKPLCAMRARCPRRAGVPAAWRTRQATWIWCIA